MTYVLVGVAALALLAAGMDWALSDGPAPRWRRYTHRALFGFGAVLLLATIAFWAAVSVALRNFEGPG